MKTLDVFLDRVDKLSLVLLDSASNLLNVSRVTILILRLAHLGPNEEGIEFGKHTEHLIRIASCTQSVT
jgi:hypothetical protein